MKFIHIADPKFTGANRLFRMSCEELNIPYCEVNANEFEYPENRDEISTKDDLLYCSANSKKGIAVENYLYVSGMATFYKGSPTVVPPDVNSHVLCHSAGVRMPKTIFSLTKDHDVLDTYVERLGGFPIVLKVLGGTRGIGVIQVDSASALYGLADYYLSTNTPVILREFIQSDGNGRLIVLGDRVIASKRNLLHGKDFRANAGEMSEESYKYSAEVENLAIQVVKESRMDFGGVDIIIDSQGNPYVLEVNFPCDFTYTQKMTGVNIATEMVQYLINKKQQK